MDLLLHFKVNEGDENNINIQEYMLYGDVETKSEKCLVDEGDEDGKYTNAWNITDNYLSDPLEMHKDDDFVIHSKKQVKDVLIPLPLEII